MKMINIKYLLLIFCGVMTLSPLLSSCQLDDPGPLPQEELFLREFIKKYGLIAPDQDWNQAERASVTVIVDRAKTVNVYIKHLSNYYIVANYADVAGEVEIPIDVPEGTETLYVEVDDVVYITEVGGTVDLMSRSGESRADNLHGNVIKIHTKSGSNDASRLIFYISSSVPSDASIFQVGDKWEFSCDVCATVDHDTYLYARGGQGLNTYFGSLNYTGGAIRFRESWMHFQAQYTIVSVDEIRKNIGTNEKPVYEYVTGFAIDLPVGKDATFYFDNIKWNVWQDNQLVQTMSYANSDFNGDVDGDGYFTEHRIFVQEPGRWDWLKNTDVVDFATDWTAIDNPQNLTWLLVAEDLGATDDFDFNDVIIQISSLSTNKAALALKNRWWQVIEDDEGHQLLKGAPVKPGSRDNTAYCELEIRAMCAGGILDSYLHFNTGTNDFILSPNNGEPWNLTTLTSLAKEDDESVTQTKNGGIPVEEWHKWFDGDNGELPNERLMLNTGLNVRNGKSCRIIVPGDFSMANYSMTFSDLDGASDKWTGNYTKPNMFDNKLTADHYSNINNTKVKGFYITTGGPTRGKCESFIAGPKAGSAPQMFLIPDLGTGTGGVFQWPFERVPITNVYPRFTTWVNTNSPASRDWYRDAPVEGAVDAICPEGVKEPGYYER